MNQRPNHRLFLRTSASALFACSALAMCSQAHGQAAPAPAGVPATAPVALPVSFPPSLIAAKASQAAPSAAQITALNDYVKRALETMATSSSPAQVKATRDTLEGASMIGPGQPASPVYERAFVAAISNAGLAEMKKPDVRGRTTVAVAIYRVAVRTRNAGLAPVVSAMLADKSEAVATWGVRSARYLYLPLLTAASPQATTLAQGMLAAMRTYPKSAGILEDVFEGLAGADVKTFALQTIPAGNLQSIDIMALLLEIRAQSFEGATPGVLPENDPKFPAMIPAPPRDLSPESKVVSFLVIDAWKAMGANTAKQKAAIGRAVYDLSDQMIRLAPLLPPAAAAADPEIRRGDLAEILKNSASAIKVTATKAVAPALSAAAAGLQELARDSNDQVGMQGKLQEIEKEMTANGLLGPKPALAPAAPAPVAPKPAVAPAKTGGATGGGTTAGNTAAKPAGTGNAAAGNSGLNK